MKKGREHLTQMLGESWENILEYLAFNGKITEKERQMFLDYFIYYTGRGEMKMILENHDISKSDLDKQMADLLIIVKATYKSLLAKALHFESLERKFNKLKFQNLQKSVFADDLFTNMRDARFLQKLDIKTVSDLLTKQINNKKTKTAEAENARLLHITQVIIDKIGL